MFRVGQRIAVAIGFSLVFAVVLVGCMDASLAQAPESTNTSIAVQQVPDSVETITLTVDGPGMEKISRTVPSGTKDLDIEVPVGPDRTFTATAGDYSASATQDVPAGGIEVALRLEAPEEEPEEEPEEDTTEDGTGDDGTTDDDNTTAEPTSTILFAANWDGDYEIYTVAADGSEPPQQLTDNAVGDSSPFYTGDGSQIVFSSERDDGNGELYVMDADGSNVRRLTTNTLSEDFFYDRISPGDDNTLLYVLEAEVGNQEIYTVTIDGATSTQLTDNSYDDAGTLPTLLGWSPDGTSILYGSDEENDTYVDLWVMDRDGSNKQELAEATGFSDYIDTARWSDAGNIVYKRNSSGETLYSIEATSPFDEAEIVSVSTDFDLGYLSVAPSGDSVAVFSNKDGSDDLYTYSLPDGAETNLTNGEAAFYTLSQTPQWSPDGTKIAARVGSYPYYQVGFINADGSGGFETVSSGDFQHSFGAWSPDGSAMVFERNLDPNVGGDFQEPVEVLYAVDTSTTPYNPTKLFDAQGTDYRIQSVQWRPQP